MKLYNPKLNVLEAARARIRRIFAEFPHIVVGFSGGKDSTVTLQLAYEAAVELDRLPLHVVFVDQEAEWSHVVHYAREVFARPGIKGHWLQCPFRIFNATDPANPWLWCWEEGGDWMRPKEPESIKENIFGTDRFGELFPAILKTLWPDRKTAYLAGVRAEESPTRFMGLTGTATYQDITWGKALHKGREHYTFYPLYDWSYTDVWKAIFDHKWPYCPVYDLLYQHGCSLNDMRVSNLHHETAVHSLFHLQEIDRATYAALTARLPGISTAAQAGKDDFFGVTELPFMFKDWREYRDYLLENLIPSAEHRAIMAKQFAGHDAKYAEFPKPDVIWQHQVSTIIANDYHGTKLASFFASPPIDAWRRWWFHGEVTKRAKNNPYINLDAPNTNAKPKAP